MGTQSIRLVFVALGLVGAIFAQPQIGGGTCSDASLSGDYWLSTAGRVVASTGTFNAVSQSVGMISFDGKGNFTSATTKNSNSATGQPKSVSGTYSMPANCYGTLTAGGTTFSLVVWAGGKSFNIVESDSSGNTSSATGGVLPSACATSTLSGAYALTANGFLTSGSSVTGVLTINGIIQFDGAGNVTSNVTLAGGGKESTGNNPGTYTVNTPSSCLGSVTFPDNKNGNTVVSFAITNPTGGDFQFNAYSSFGIFAGSAHPVFANPSQSVADGASFVSDLVAPGSIFSIFGTDLGPKGGAYGSGLPLPTTVAGMSVTVNGENAPIFYAGSGQINAQMPVDVKPGLATVTVTNGTTPSNSAAVYVPSAAPGIFTYGPNNHAVVINPYGATNSDAIPAHVGDEVVAYFTGGGPVNASGPWTTGDAAPPGESPLSESSFVTVNGKAAQVAYIGLTGGSVGLYQVNFVIPQVVAGDHPLVITVNGVKSKPAMISIAN
jgi:uncharacterized protein (TIGR03437 family)